MARIRTIKPEFWTDEKIVELSPLARLLFIGLWNFADDEGRMVFSQTRIKLQILPADAAEISALLGEIRGKKLIEVYAIDGTEYLQVVNFGLHQKVDKRTPSKYPPPPTAPAEVLRIVPTEGNGMEGIKEGKGKEEKTMSGKPDPHPAFKEKAKTLLAFLNAKTQRNYHPVDANLKFLVALLKSGVSEDDIRSVVAKKCREWTGNEKMQEFLRPKTLFNQTNFAQYHGELIPEERLAQ